MAKLPEFKTCRFMTEAIVTVGSEKGEVRKVCVNPECPIHRPKKQPSRENATAKAEQEKERREEALANATGLHVLSSLVATVALYQREPVASSGRAQICRHLPGPAESGRRTVKP